MKKLSFIFLILSMSIVVAGCNADTPKQWEHGYKTSRVIATRYKNPEIGYNIGFLFPQNPNDFDRAEISEFIEMHGGSIFANEGGKGSESFATFTDVKDKESADIKIKEVLPGLTTLMININNPGYTKNFEAKFNAWDKKNNSQLQWPDTTPPDKTDPNWEFNNNMNLNGIQYLKVEVSPGKWQWQVNQAVMAEEYKEESDRRHLFYSLSRRKLTHEELMHIDDNINVQMNVAFNQNDKYVELYDFLVQQWELQTGRKMEGYFRLSDAKGEYNQTPQEKDNKVAVDYLILKLQNMTLKSKP
jgi:hypothetical protein